MGDETVEIVREFIEQADLSNRLNTDQARQIATEIVQRLRDLGHHSYIIEGMFKPTKA